MQIIFTESIDVRDASNNPGNNNRRTTHHDKSVLTSPIAIRNPLINAIIEITHKHNTTNLSLVINVLH